LFAISLYLHLLQMTLIQAKNPFSLLSEDDF
jgi:hypothetical protein